MPTGVNLNQNSGSDSCIPWHSDNESLFSPQNQTELTVSVSLGYSVVFQVRRAPRGVLSPIRLNHGDILVMDGLAQSEYDTARCLVCRVLGLTYIPLGKTAHCVLSTSKCNVLCSALVRARFSRAGFSSVWGWEKSLVLLLGNLLVRTWLVIREERCHSGRRPSCPEPFPQTLLRHFLMGFFRRKNAMFFL